MEGIDMRQSAIVAGLAIALFTHLVAHNMGKFNAHAWARAELRAACDIPDDDRADLKAGWYTSTVTP